MPRRGIHGGQHGEIDAVGHDSAFLQWPRDLVVAASKYQRNALRQLNSPLLAGVVTMLACYSTIGPHRRLQARHTQPSGVNELAVRAVFERELASKRPTDAQSSPLGQQV